MFSSNQVQCGGLNILEAGCWQTWAAGSRIMDMQWATSESRCDAAMVLFEYVAATEWQAVCRYAWMAGHTVAYK
jgi:hypothetical protein